MSHLRVLHIEDDPLDARAMVRWLSSTIHSYELDQAPSLEGAKDLAGSKKYDVVLLDLSLPDGNGDEVLIKARSCFSKAPIIVVTGNIDQRQAENFVELGADDYLFKSELNGAILWKSIIYSCRKKNLEAELQQRAEELKRVTELEKKANLSKTEFLANVSHDLRTPIGVILGYSEILEKMPHISAEAIQYVQRIKTNSRGLVSLVNDLLDLSKVEKGHMDIHLSASDLLTDLREILSNQAFKASQKGLDFSVCFDSPFPCRGKIDRIRVGQILDNLISNAIKFTDSGSIKVGVRTSVLPDAPSASLEFTVADTGTGIAEHAKGLIFEPFQQGDPGLHYKYVGSGLGLSVAYKLAVIMKGTVELVESAIGQGSVFRFVLPVELSENMEFWSDPEEEFYNSSGVRKPGLSKEVMFQGAKLLLAEDNPDNQYLIECYLKSKGLRMFTVDNGKDAVDRATAEKFDAILMDMQMPVMTGFEAVSQLRRQGYRGAIIALTAFAMKEEKDRCLQAGCDDYISKPISPKVLLETLQKYCVIKSM